MRIGNELRSNTPTNPYSSQMQYFSRKQNVLPQWKIGDTCKAPWTDGTVCLILSVIFFISLICCFQYYLATIVNLGPADMCAVRYNEYGNIMTVPQAVLLLV